MELSTANLLKVYGRPLGLRLLAGEKGIDRTINSSDIHRPGLTLTGFVEVVTFSLVQILGNHEIEYLRSLTPEKRRQSLEILYQFEMPCVVITGRGRLLPELRSLADKYNTPLLRTEFDTTKFIHCTFISTTFSHRRRASMEHSLMSTAWDCFSRAEVQSERVRSAWILLSADIASLLTILCSLPGKPRES